MVVSKGKVWSSFPFFISCVHRLRHLARKLSLAAGCHLGLIGMMSCLFSHFSPVIRKSAGLRVRPIDGAMNELRFGNQAYKTDRLLHANN